MSVPGTIVGYSSIPLPYSSSFFHPNKTLILFRMIMDPKILATRDGTMVLQGWHSSMLSDLLSSTYLKFKADIWKCTLQLQITIIL